ncbi:MAG TPA: hypothetical protein VKX49_17630 [Bryobacteraceae bacterium]|nr:hypothetical protein [Bryobacteraceae bacterium]
MKPIKDQLEEKLPWLFSELGFRIVSYSFDPAHFDNSTAVLEGPSFRLRFVRDMGLINAQVAPVSDPERWSDLKFVYEAVFRETPEPTLEGYGPLLRGRLADLAEALGPKLPQTIQLLDRYAAERYKIMTQYYASRRPLGDEMLSRIRATRIGRIVTGPLIWVLIVVLLWVLYSWRGRL